MTEPLKFLISPPASGKENMRVDTEMFESLRAGGAPSLRLYTWKEKTITIGRGWKTKFGKQNAQFGGTDLIERPTGGGLVVHEAEGELTIALAHRRERGVLIRELYRKIHEPIMKSLAAFNITGELVTECLPEGDGICFNSPCLYDGMSEGKKILGGGLRVGKAQSNNSEYVFLYQGTLKLPGLAMKDFSSSLMNSPVFASLWGKPIITQDVGCRL